MHMIIWLLFKWLLIDRMKNICYDTADKWTLKIQGKDRNDMDKKDIFIRLGADRLGTSRLVKILKKR